MPSLNFSFSSGIDGSQGTLGWTLPNNIAGNSDSSSATCLLVGLGDNTNRLIGTANGLGTFLKQAGTSLKSLSFSLSGYTKPLGTFNISIAEYPTQILVDGVLRSAANVTLGTFNIESRYFGPDINFILQGIGAAGLYSIDSAIISIYYEVDNRIYGIRHGQVAHRALNVFGN